MGPMFSLCQMMVDVVKCKKGRNCCNCQAFSFDNRYPLVGGPASIEKVSMIHLDHNNRRSGKWNNDGLIVFQSAKPE